VNGEVHILIVLPTILCPFLRRLGGPLNQRELGAKENIHNPAGNRKSVGFEVLTAVVMKSTIFWDITPCIPLSVRRRFGGTYRLHLQGRNHKLSKKPAVRAEFCLPPGFTLVSCSAYSSTLKMMATSSSETSVDFQRTTWRYIPEGCTLRIP
jgi:hypothetical protein